MKISLKLLVAVFLPLVFSCSQPHLITDSDYLHTVDSCFNERKQLSINRSDALFSVFNSHLNLKQQEALKFLYAFMPLSDLADYTGEFFLRNVNISLDAINSAPWGKNIPEAIYLHYVLPCRINNENLDSFRIAYYDEIKNRIRGKGMVDAALEINHWCHEKVSYQAADIRTSAPMSTILSSRGRCGEESTFTVAALRTAGIPARQVYTPRWAHTDDNHAWVEIWSDGQWYYFGACEPEAVIDRGWFTEPARRAMLIHTKSFGAAFGKENVVNKHKYFSEVNNLAKYAVTKKIFVKVSDKAGAPVKNASVEYQLYNYAEFYPIAVVPTDKNGISSFETGLGDLLVWAHKQNIFSYRKISVAETDTLKLTLDRQAGEKYGIELDLDVPLALDPLPGPSKELAESNSKLLETENTIRKKYADSWMTTAEAKKWASSRKIDSTRAINAFSRAMGNYREIRSFLDSTPDSLIQRAFDLIEVIADKDVRDTRASILSDHLLNTPVLSASGFNYDIFVDYVLNPRIANEIIKPWRGYFLKDLPSDLLIKGKSDPAMIAEYLTKEIKVNDDENYYKTPITPAGVYELKVSDAFSREICFVAMCRSLGVPARLEPGSMVPQYYLNSAWNDVYFPERTKPDGARGWIKLISSGTKPVPAYYTQFTLARFDNGRYNTLEYDYERKITDFRDELSLAPGSYMLVTGNRLSDGKILTSLTFFNLGANEHKIIDVKIRKEPAENIIRGKIDLSEIRSVLQKENADMTHFAEKGAVIFWIDPEKEPTKHIFNELPHLKDELDDWGGSFVFLTDPGNKWVGFKTEELKNLPSGLLCGSDRIILGKSFNINSSDPEKLPFVAVCDKNGNVLYTSSGYRIGIGEQILRYIR
jgi:transglutaminase-like putative cysteine protease